MGAYWNSAHARTTLTLVSLTQLHWLSCQNQFYLKQNCIDNGDKEGEVTKEDTAEVDDEKDVLEEVFRGGVCHLEELLKGYWHGLDLKKHILMKN